MIGKINVFTEVITKGLSKSVHEGVWTEENQLRVARFKSLAILFLLSRISVSIVCGNLVKKLNNRSQRRLLIASLHEFYACLYCRQWLLNSNSGNEGTKNPLLFCNQCG